MTQPRVFAFDDVLSHLWFVGFGDVEKGTLLFWYELRVKFFTFQFDLFMRQWNLLIETWSLPALHTWNKLTRLSIETRHMGLSLGGSLQHLLLFTWKLGIMGLRSQRVWSVRSAFAYLLPLLEVRVKIECRWIVFFTTWNTLRFAASHREMNAVVELLTRG